MNCRNGHPRTPENTHTRPDGTVRCRKCEAERWRNRTGRKVDHDKLKAAAVAALAMLDNGSPSVAAQVLRDVMRATR